MAEIKAGDRVRVQNRTDWPTPPGYILANAEGTVTRWLEWPEPMEKYQDFIYVRLEKTEPAAKEYVGLTWFFREENLEKI